MLKRIYIFALITTNYNLLADCLPKIDLNIFDPDKISLSLRIAQKVYLNDKIPPFYTKVSKASGIYITSSENVSDEAHKKAAEIITKMIGNNSDISKSLIEQKATLAIFGDNEKVSDLPEMSSFKGSKTFDGRMRDDTCGTGGVFGRPVTTVCEKNLLKKPNDPYYGRSDICTHEFAHTIMNVGFTPEQKNQINQLYQLAKSRNLYQAPVGYSYYEMQNSEEFFAVLSSAWFNSIDTKGNVHSKDLSDKESIKKIFPEMYHFLSTIYKD
jgi:alpha-glucosidase